MPVIELKHVLSFSSEDAKCPAQNLLKGDGFKKWKSANVGEKQVSVVLQFEKASQIQSLDIGNEASAFIEVLVARSTEKAEPDFQVLLVASSFMNPLESKSSTNLNRVRMFDKEKLATSLLGQKWDLVKVVCTQPFNKNVQYGLSFVKFHAPSENESESDQAAKTNPAFGMFRMREKVKEDAVKVGSAFSAYKREAPDVSGTSASASARSVSKFADEVLAREAAAVRAKVGERAEESRAPKRKMEANGSEIARKRSRDSPPVTPGNGKREETKRRNTPEPRRRTPDQRRRSRTPERRRRSRTPERRRRSPERRKSPVTRPFSKLMSNVVFAMSGYQNPERGELRDQACDMGATYKSDWGRGCTHLICAFVNTPKYNVVRGKGRIVEADWITRCYKEKKLLPWRRFRVGKARTPPGSSDEECIAEERAVKKSTDSSTKTDEKRSERKTEKKEESSSVLSPSVCKPSTSKLEQKPSTSSMAVKKNALAYNADSSTDEDAVYDRDTDVDDMDTDDEIERIQTAESTEKKHASPATNKKEKLNLPDFFDGCNFFVYGDMTPGDRRTLKRIIIAYRGQLDEYMGDGVTHVLTRAKWDSNFDKALGENEKLKFVRPEWVYECDRAQKTVGYETFCVESD